MERGWETPPGSLPSRGSGCLGTTLIDLFPAALVCCRLTSPPSCPRPCGPGEMEREARQGGSQLRNHAGGDWTNVRASRLHLVRIREGWYLRHGGQGDGEGGTRRLASPSSAWVLCSKKQSERGSGPRPNCVHCCFRNWSSLGLSTLGPLQTSKSGPMPPSRYTYALDTLR